MEIKHVSGEIVDTHKLSDVDALLMEESKKLYDLFFKYNRQLCLVGEMKGSFTGTLEQGCSFFHINNVGTSQEQATKRYYEFMTRLDGVVRGITCGGAFIAKVSPK